MRQFTKRVAAGILALSIMSTCSIPAFAVISSTTHTTDPEAKMTSVTYGSSANSTNPYLPYLYYTSFSPQVAVTEGDKVVLNLAVNGANQKVTLVNNVITAENVLFMDNDVIRTRYNLDTIGNVERTELVDQIKKFITLKNQYVGDAYRDSWKTGVSNINSMDISTLWYNLKLAMFEFESAVAELNLSDTVVNSQQATLTAAQLGLENLTENTAVQSDIIRQAREIEANITAIVNQYAVDVSNGKASYVSHLDLDNYTVPNYSEGISTFFTQLADNKDEIKANIRNMSNSINDLYGIYSYARKLKSGNFTVFSQDMNKAGDWGSRVDLYTSWTGMLEKYVEQYEGFTNSNTLATIFKDNTTAVNNLINPVRTLQRTPLTNPYDPNPGKGYTITESSVTLWEDGNSQLSGLRNISSFATQESLNKIQEIRNKYDTVIQFKEALSTKLNEFYSKALSSSTYCFDGWNACVDDYTDFRGLIYSKSQLSNFDFDYLYSVKAGNKAFTDSDLVGQMEVSRYMSLWQFMNKSVNEDSSRNTADALSRSNPYHVSAWELSEEDETALQDTYGAGVNTPVALNSVSARIVMYNPVRGIQTVYSSTLSPSEVSSWDIGQEIYNYIDKEITTAYSSTAWETTYLDELTLSDEELHSMITNYLVERCGFTDDCRFVAELVYNYGGDGEQLSEEQLRKDAPVGLNVVASIPEYSISEYYESINDMQTLAEYLETHKGVIGNINSVLAEWASKNVNIPANIDFKVAVTPTWESRMRQITRDRIYQNGSFIDTDGKGYHEYKTEQTNIYNITNNRAVADGEWDAAQREYTGWTYTSDINQLLLGGQVTKQGDLECDDYVAVGAQARGRILSNNNTKKYYALQRLCTPLIQFNNTEGGSNDVQAHSAVNTPDSAKPYLKAYASTNSLPEMFWNFDTLEGVKNLNYGETLEEYPNKLGEYDPASYNADYYIWISKTTETDGIYVADWIEGANILPSTDFDSLIDYTDTKKGKNSTITKSKLPNETSGGNTRVNTNDTISQNTSQTGVTTVSGEFADYALDKYLTPTNMLYCDKYNVIFPADKVEEHSTVYYEVTVSGTKFITVTKYKTITETHSVTVTAPSWQTDLLMAEKITTAVADDLDLGDDFDFLTAAPDPNYPYGQVFGPGTQNGDDTGYGTTAVGNYNKTTGHPPGYYSDRPGSRNGVKFADMPKVEFTHGEDGSVAGTVEQLVQMYGVQGLLDMIQNTPEGILPVVLMGDDTVGNAEWSQRVTLEQFQEYIKNHPEDPPEEKEDTPDPPSKTPPNPCPEGWTPSTTTITYTITKVIPYTEVVAVPFSYTKTESMRVCDDEHDDILYLFNSLQYGDVNYGLDMSTFLKDGGNWVGSKGNPLKGTNEWGETFVSEHAVYDNGTEIPGTSITRPDESEAEAALTAFRGQAEARSESINTSNWDKFTNWNGRDDEEKIAEKPSTTSASNRTVGYVAFGKENENGEAAFNSEFTTGSKPNQIRGAVATNGDMTGKEIVDYQRHNDTWGDIASQTGTPDTWVHLEPSSNLRGLIYNRTNDTFRETTSADTPYIEPNFNNGLDMSAEELKEIGRGKAVVEMQPHTYTIVELIARLTAEDDSVNRDGKNIFDLPEKTTINEDRLTETEEGIDTYKWQSDNTTSNTSYNVVPEVLMTYKTGFADSNGNLLERENRGVLGSVYTAGYNQYILDFPLYNRIKLTYKPDVETSSSAEAVTQNAKKLTTNKGPIVVYTGAEMTSTFTVEPESDRVVEFSSWALDFRQTDKAASAAVAWNNDYDSANYAKKQAQSWLDNFHNGEYFIAKASLYATFTDKATDWSTSGTASTSNSETSVTGSSTLVATAQRNENKPVQSDVEFLYGDSSQIHYGEGVAYNITIRNGRLAQVEVAGEEPYVIYYDGNITTSEQLLAKFKSGASDHGTILYKRHPDLCEAIINMRLVELAATMVHDGGREQWGSWKTLDTYTDNTGNSVGNVVKSEKNYMATSLPDSYWYAEDSTVLRLVNYTTNSNLPEQIGVSYKIPANYGYKSPNNKLDLFKADAKIWGWVETAIILGNEDVPKVTEFNLNGKEFDVKNIPYTSASFDVIGNELTGVEVVPPSKQFIISNASVTDMY